MKAKLLQDGPEKTFALVFDTGEEVVAALLRFAREQKLTAAHLTAIGAFARVTLGFFEPSRKEYTPIAIEEQVELLSLVGNVARGDKGEAKLHAHVVVGKSDGTAHGGHLLEASVRPTMEIVVVESSRHLRRRMREDVGAALLDLSS
jgi:predicted DNA-binding protein with PD1-like motif